MKAAHNSGYSGWAYVVDRKYAQNPEHYVRAFLLIQSDLQRLFEFVEPADQNLSTYSYRMHELLMRTCIEVEANFKAILRENKFTIKSDRDWNISDYKKVNITHRLSSFKVTVPIWEGTRSYFEPFSFWSAGHGLPWYQAYNASKHDRHNKFKKANLGNLLNAVSGLLVLLSAQFGNQDFSPGPTGLSVAVDSYYSTQPALGGFFHIEIPNDWSDDEKYDFDWASLKTQPDRFQKIDYDKIGS